MIDAPAAPHAPPAARLAWLDTFRGVAIVAVVLIHVLPRVFGQLATGSKTWYVLAAAHRLCFFAVPGFLLLSTLVNTASLLRKPDLRRYARARVLGVVWPYVVWSALYIAYQRWLTPAGYSLYDVPHALWYGKAWPPLYFMVVLIQLLVLLPLLAPVARAWPGFGAVCLGALALTSAAWYLNVRLHLSYPGSFVLWYVPPIAIGLWLAGRGRAPDVALRRALPWAAAVAAIAAVAYVAIYLRVALRLPVPRFSAQPAEWLYVSAASLLVLALCERWGRDGRAGDALRLLGDVSLQIYLAHPFVLIALDRLDAAHRLGPAAMLVVYTSLSLALPLAFALALRRLHLSPLLFGR